MTIASFPFLAFALAIVVAYNALSARAWRKAVLLVANLAFLTTFSHNPKAFVPLAAFVLCGYIAVRFMQRQHNDAAYLCTVTTFLLVFFWLKRYTFLPHASFLQMTYTTLGLSYIFFRVMHMIIDAHGGNLDSDIELGGYLNYTLNFATLVSGPIQRYPEFIEQHLPLVRPPLTVFDMGEGLERIIVGFFKANVLALLLSLVHNHAINALSASQPAGSRAATGAVIVGSYTLYLFFNFSGYTDIVIGISSFLRIRLPENFRRPFSADNFLEFWNRWHITLSHWLRTYVYNPLLTLLMRRFQSNQIEPFLGVFAFFVTFFLIGLWHGQTSEFIFYGALLGAGVSLNKLYQVEMAKILGKKQYKTMANQWVYQTICRGITFTFFSVSLLWFWSTWKDLGEMSRTLGLPSVLAGCAILLVTSTVVLAAWEFIRTQALRLQWGGQPFVHSRYVRTVWDTALTFVLIGVMELLNSPAPDIVYKAF